MQSEKQSGHMQDAGWSPMYGLCTLMVVWLAESCAHCKITLHARGPGKDPNSKLKYDFY